MQWFRTPPESPDMNAVENVWGALKYDLRELVPTTMKQLNKAIMDFWKRHLTIKQCNKYIDHVQYKVLKRVVAVKGSNSGY